MSKKNLIGILIGFGYGVFLYSVGFSILTWQYWVFLAFQMAFFLLGAL
jgi:hypothetical protein